MRRKSSFARLMLTWAAASAALALAGCAAGPLSLVGGLLLSLAFGLGLGACYVHTGDPENGDEGFTVEQPAPRPQPGPSPVPSPARAVDGDGDGYLSDVDCDDENPSVNPGAIESPCNFADLNCDGIVFGATCNPIPDADLDGDGWLAPQDCNDADPNVYPGAPDRDPCDNYDQNCDAAEFVCNPFEDAGTEDPFDTTQ